MNITLCSAFRNSTSYLDRYFTMVATLNHALRIRGENLELVLGEGDSTDNTSDVLRCKVLQWGIPATLVDVSHGGLEFGSFVDPQRFKQLAYVGNCVWSQIPASADVALWCESDLIWSADTLVALIDRLKEYPCVAPMVMHQTDPGLYAGEGPFFFDTFSYRRNGVRFTNQPPYHPDLNGDMLQMDSVGSCVVMNAALARRVHFDESVIVGICRQIYEMGASVWLDSSLSVYHP